MNSKSLVYGQILLTALLACLPAGRRGGMVYAADKPVPLKTYRNHQVGFQFQYPANMQVFTSSMTAPACDQRHWQDSDDVHVVDCSPKSNSAIWAVITVGHSIDENYCLHHDDESIRYGTIINGFSEAELIAEGGMGRTLGSQDYVKFHNGKCAHIVRNVESYRANGAESSPRIDKNPIVYYDPIKEIIKSFRFLDSEPKVK